MYREGRSDADRLGKSPHCGHADATLPRDLSHRAIVCPLDGVEQDRFLGGKSFIVVVNNVKKEADGEWQRKKNNVVITKRFEKIRMSIFWVSLYSLQLFP